MAIEAIIKNVYGRFLEREALRRHQCPSEEELASFLEGCLKGAALRKMEGHLALCGRCAETAAVYCRARSLENNPVFEVVLRLKDRFMELLKTTGEVVLGGDIAPVPVLRGGGIKEFKEEICLVKELEGIRIALRLDKKDRERVKIAVELTDSRSLKPIKDLRVTLSRNALELESYFAKSGAAVFDGLTYGAYAMEISRRENSIGIIKLEIK